MGSELGQQSHEVLEAHGVVALFAVGGIAHLFSAGDDELGALLIESVLGANSHQNLVLKEVFWQVGLVEGELNDDALGQIGVVAVGA